MANWDRGGAEGNRLSGEIAQASRINMAVQIAVESHSLVTPAASKTSMSAFLIASSRKPSARPTSATVSIKASW